VTAAAASFAKTMPADFRVSLTNAPGANAYPIASYTWLLVPERIKDNKKRAATVHFLQWMLTEGQAQVAPLNYARLPSAVVAKELKAISLISAP
jgi:phosphate transport system substrate-binding protein